MRIKNSIVFVVRCIFFFFYPSLFAAGFMGIKQIIIAITEEHKPLTLTSFVITLLLLLGITCVCGRVFCGYMCAFGFYGDVLYTIGFKIRRKMKRKEHPLLKKRRHLWKYLKYIVLIGVLLMCLFHKSELLDQNSPWTTFSRLMNGKFDGWGIGIGLLILISAGMINEERFFCNYLCPFGAIFSLIPVLPRAIIKRNCSNCITNCKACQNKCPAGIVLPDENDEWPSGTGDCYQCMKCVYTCPKGNISRGTRIIGGRK